ncbi:aspartate-semialdehyde dehydrogenase [Marinicella gelatinilytica]|uniref:aspartate-semialdehyde dehydrogenase n=1 Tax=Marinicella gelatinilytica TaxID=2996017 RepID=UPI002260AE6D|nr:aspartate-semialdehyde dehydrogenase [Marinicella gelatinilytica]MCX7546044.1 aspartate-semialdehyde dehydrogenase [Marinicella gelatinilytica]
MKEKLNIAIVGATGAVGRIIIELLESRQFPVNQLTLLASANSAGESLSFAGKAIIVQPLETFDFKGYDLAFFTAGSQVSAQYASRAVDTQCVVIDNTSYFRNEEDVPLVIPEVNGEEINRYQDNYIIANPNCSTIQMLLALAPIHKAVGIERINVATYQSVSGAGQKGIDELALQTRSLLNFKPLQQHVFSGQIAFNVLPHIDDFQDNGYTREEMKMVWETQKILDDRSIQVNPTCVRVPVFYGHSEAVHIETRDKITAQQARQLLTNADGIEIVDDPAKLSYPSPAITAAGNDAVYVGRIREDISYPKGLNMWIVSDNIRKGAALNSVQIAELLIKKL